MVQRRGSEIIRQTCRGDEEVLRLHITMEVAVTVNMVQAGGDLVETAGDETRSERSSSSGFGELIEVAFHTFKDEVEFVGFG